MSILLEKIPLLLLQSYFDSKLLSKSFCILKESRTGDPRYSRIFTLQFPLAKWIENAYFLVKNAYFCVKNELFICVFTIFGSKWNDGTYQYEWRRKTVLSCLCLLQKNNESNGWKRTGFRYALLILFLLLWLSIRLRTDLAFKSWTNNQPRVNITNSLRAAFCKKVSVADFLYLSTVWLCNGERILA